MPPEELTITDIEPTPKTNRWWLWVVGALCVALVAIATTCGWLLSAPEYAGERSITVTPGQSVSTVVANVAGIGVVRSETALYALTQLYYADETIETGTYTFTATMSTLEVAEHLMLYTPADELISLTFPEGISVGQMGDIAARYLDEVDARDFVAAASEHEGMLWPETYFVPVDYTTAELVTLLQENHAEAIESYAAAIASSSLSEYEMLTLASIIEREANDTESMKLVAGILLNRLDIGMALQADATIEYVLEDRIADLQPGQLAQNLREIDSPYNTYLYTGLPPTPIGNPGQTAIEAVLYPTPSEYLFYITDLDGEFHYATTYEQHLVNIERYLR